MTTDPWTVRGIEIRGRAEADDSGAGLIRIHDRVISWGMESGFTP